MNGFGSASSSTNTNTNIRPSNVLKLYFRKMVQRKSAPDKSIANAHVSCRPVWNRSNGRKKQNNPIHRLITFEVVMFIFKLHLNMIELRLTHLIVRTINRHSSSCIHARPSRTVHLHVQRKMFSKFLKARVRARKSGVEHKICYIACDRVRMQKWE